MTETTSTSPAACGCGCPGCMGHSGAAFSISAALSTAESSGDGNIDALVVGADTRWGPHMMGAGYTVTYSFMESLPSYHGSDSSFTTFNETMKAAARQALDAWASVSNLSFVEVSDAGDGGEIRFGANFQASSAGYAYYPSTSDIGGDIMIANNYAYNLAPEVGTYGYLTLLHEIGHAIGLKHPGNYSGTGSGPFLSSDLDNYDTTVMSYYEGPSGVVSALGWLDVASVQYMYGQSSAGSSGNVTWGADTAEVFAGDGGINYFLGNGGADLFVLAGGNDGAMGGTATTRCPAGPETICCTVISVSTCCWAAPATTPSSAVRTKARQRLTAAERRWPIAKGRISFRAARAVT